MTDNWDSYLCEVEGKPASILVDLGAVTQAPMPDFPCLGYVTVPLRNPDENGFPDREEFETLSLVEDALEAGLTAGGTAVHIGRCITGGRYELIFYTVRSGDWHSRVAGIMVDLPPYDWEAGAHYEPDWGTYLGFLFPGGQDMLTIQNRRLLRQLRERGDALEKPRPISHWLDLLDSEDGEAFCRAARERGFQVEEAGMVSGSEENAVDPDNASSDPLPGSGPGLARLAFAGTEEGRPFFQVRLSRMDAPEHIDEVSFILLDLVLEHGGEYRGWSCPVEV